MKKTLLSLSVLVAGFTAKAQFIDTLHAHVTAGFTELTAGGLDAVAPIDSGFIGGNNFYGDVAKLQKFTTGSGGTITGLSFFSIVKIGTGNVTFSIHADAAGQANLTPLGSATVALSAIDTANANWMALSTGQIYNNTVTFSPAITIPAGNSFWVNCALPTAATDLFSLVLDNNFAQATTNSAEIWSDGAWNFMNPAWSTTTNYGFCMYPIVNTTTTIEENVIEASVSPNPVNNELNINIAGEVSNVQVTNLDGKIVATATTSNIDVTTLSAGTYIFTVSTVEGKLATGKFVKN